MNNKKWNKEILNKELIQLHAKEKKGYPIKLYKDYPKVYQACLRLHGSIEEALNYAKIPIDDVNFFKNRKNKKWANEKIKRGFLDLLEKQRLGEKIYFNKDCPDLRSACKRLFGTVENAAQFFNLDDKLNFIRGKNKYKWANNPKMILTMLKDLYIKNPDGYPDFYIKQKALARACENYYKSLRNALEQVGIPHK